MPDPKDGTRHGNHVKISDSDKELNTFLDDLRDAGMRVTNKWKDIWFTAIQYAWGQQLQNMKLKEDWEYTVVNRIYPLMFQTIAKLAGNHPKILTHAWDDEKEGATEYAEKWANHLQYLWESPYELNMRLKLIKGLLDCAVFGYMVGKTQWEDRPRRSWDNVQKKWIGKVTQIFVHPAMFWTDPSAETIDDAENLGTIRRVKLEWAVNRWPEHKEAFEREAFTSESPEFTAGDMISYKDQKGSTLSVSMKKQFSRIAEMILDTGAAEGKNSRDQEVSGNDQKYVNIEETYWQDYTEEHVVIKDIVPPADLIQQGKIVKEEITGLYIDTETGKAINTDDWPTVTLKEYDEPKFPNGRFVVRINRTILNPDEKDQVYTEKKWPFSVMPYHILPHMWQGGNAVELSRRNNDILNITVSSLVNQMRRTADPNTVIEANTLAKDRFGKARTTRDDITGLGRMIIVARGKSDKIRHLEYPAIDPATVLLGQRLQQDIDDQMFMQDVARGAATQGQQTKAEIVRLNRNSLDYVALQGIFLDKFIDDTAGNTAELAQNNYEPGRLINVLADETKSGFRIDQGFLDVRFEVNIEPGSTLPFDEAKTQAEYKMAYDLLNQPVPNPMIDEMLRILNISKRQEILDRYQGLQLFHQFIALGVKFTEALKDDPQEAAQIVAQVEQIPGMKQLMSLLTQAGALAGQIKT
jgi:hypothetical protein